MYIDIKLDESSVVNNPSKRRRHCTIYALKGQSSALIFQVECKNLFVIGPSLGLPNIFDFGLVYTKIFIFENGLPGESKLPMLFTAGSQNSPSRLIR